MGENTFGVARSGRQMIERPNGLERTQEAQLVDAVRQFLCTHGLVSEKDCHFDGDGEYMADVELMLSPGRWPEEMPLNLVLEAKSHHSKDSPNTVNKIFGQLMKESSKTRTKKSFCLGLLIPTDGAQWKDGSGKTITRGSGIVYYQTAFKRIKANLFSEYGRLVNARYILAFSVSHQELCIFGWEDFYHGAKPLHTLVALRR